MYFSWYKMNWHCGSKNFSVNNLITTPAVCARSPKFSSVVLLRLLARIKAFWSDASTLTFDLWCSHYECIWSTNELWRFREVDGVRQSKRFKVAVHSAPLPGPLLLCNLSCTLTSCDRWNISRQKTLSCTAVCNVGYSV